MVKNDCYAERAKIFMPFDALKGFKEALKEKEKIVVERIELSDEEKDKLIYKLDNLKKGLLIKIVYYNNQEYIELKGIVAMINAQSKMVTIVNKKIRVEDVLSLEFLDDDYLYTASSTDMTGLVPNGGHNDYELENFNKLYPSLPNTTQVVPNTPVAELTFKEKNLKNKSTK